MVNKCCYACRVSLKRDICMNEQIILCDDCVATTNIMISKYNAKKNFNLDESDLIGVPHNIIKKNKYTYTTYYYDDILSKAYKKYGGITPYIKKNNLVANPDKYTIDILCDMKKCRADLILSTTDKLKCDYRSKADIIYNYIEHGDESGYDYNEICELLEKN